MSFCIFNQQRADGTQNTATSPMLQRCVLLYLRSMYRIIFFFTFFFVLALLDAGCLGKRSRKKSEVNAGNAYLFRKHMDKDSTWIEPNTNCYFADSARMNMNHGGWHWATDLQQSEGDFFYWEAETWGAVKLEFDLPPKTTTLNFDTIQKLNHDFINNFYGYARSDSTVDHLSGTLTLRRDVDREITINGTIKIDTEKPTTHQEIVFNNYSMKIQSLDEAIQNHKARQDEIRKQLLKQLQ